MHLDGREPCALRAPRAEPACRLAPFPPGSAASSRKLAAVSPASAGRRDPPADAPFSSTPPAASFPVRGFLHDSPPEPRLTLADSVNPCGSLQNRQGRGFRVPLLSGGVDSTPTDELKHAAARAGCALPGQVRDALPPVDRWDGGDLPRVPAWAGGFPQAGGASRRERSRFEGEGWSGGAEEGRCRGPPEP